MPSDDGDGDHTRGIKHGEQLKELQKDSQRLRDAELAIARLEEKTDQAKPTFWREHGKLIIFAIVIMFLGAIGFTAGDIREVLGL